MGNEKIIEGITTTPPAKDAPALVKKIGRSTYIVRVHFSKSSKETMSDKKKKFNYKDIRTTFPSNRIPAWRSNFYRNIC